MLENQFIDIVEFETTIHNYLERYKRYRGTSAPLMCLVISFTLKRHPSIYSLFTMYHMGIE